VGSLRRGWRVGGSGGGRRRRWEGRRERERSSSWKVGLLKR